MIRYNALPTAAKMMRDDSFLRILRGPVASGKTTAGIMEIIRRAKEMPPSVAGDERRSRWVIMSPTTNQSRDGAVRSLLGLLAPYGYYNDAEATFLLNYEDVRLEIIFCAQDNISKILSLEITGAFIDNLDQCTPEVLNNLAGRVGRYPRVCDVPEKFWYGIIGSTTKRLEALETWHDELKESPMLQNAIIFDQPRSWHDNPENTENLPEGFYERLIKSLGTPHWML